jgi:TPR repeat protein
MAPVAGKTVEVGAVFAQKYRVEAALADHLAGKCYRGVELGPRALAVSLLVLSREFLADPRRLTALETAVERLRAAPHPAVRQVLGLETAGNQPVLVEEWLGAPSLRELLRARGQLSAPEVVAVLEGLAGAADHGRQQGLEHLDVRLGGVQLWAPGLGPAGADWEPWLGRPLGRWAGLRVWLAPIDFRFEAQEAATWTGGATLVEAAGAGAGPAGSSYVRQLSLLAYELLGGSRGVLESQGRYRPLAALPESGNQVLRRGLVDEIGTAGELVRALAATLGIRAAAASVQNSSLQGAPPVSSFGAAGEPPASTAQSRGKALASVPGLLRTLLFTGVALAAIGLGGYGIYRSLNPAQKKLLALKSPAPALHPTARTAFQPPAPVTPEITMASSPITSPASGAAMPSPVLAMSGRTAMIATPETDPLEQALSDAQSAGRNGSWDKALSTYVDLAERYPNRQEPRQRLANLLAEGRKNGTRVNEENFATLKPVLERAARQGVVPAMLILAQNLRPNQPDEALSWYEKAAQKGNSDGMVQAGLLYSSHHTPEDNRKALEYFIQAADAGNRDGKYLAGECFYYPKPGLVPDEAKALEYLHEAAALGELRSMNLLGTYYRKIRRYDEARRYLEEGARGGLPLAMANLGVLYVNGEGVTRNPEKAVELFRQAAEQGDAGGMYLYGQCFFNGVGRPKDIRTANEWFRKAARGGNPSAIEYCRRNNLEYR